MMFDSPCTRVHTPHSEPPGHSETWDSPGLFISGGRLAALPSSLPGTGGPRMKKQLLKNSCTMEDKSNIWWRGVKKCQDVK